MALVFTGAGVASAASGASPQAVTTVTALAAGDRLVVLMSYDNSGGSGADPMSGTIAATPASGTLGASGSAQTGLNDPAGASAGLAVRCVGFPVTSAIASGTVINISWSGTVVVRAVALMKVSSNVGGNIVNYRTNSGATGSNTVANASLTAHTTPSVTSGEGVLCWLGFEYGAAPTGDSDTTNGSWTSIYGTNTGTTTSGQGAYFQGKVVSATATQSWQCTNGANATDWICGSLIFTEFTPTHATVTTPTPASSAATANVPAIASSVAISPTRAIAAAVSPAVTTRLTSEWSNTASATPTGGGALITAPTPAASTAVALAPSAISYGNTITTPTPAVAQAFGRAPASVSTPASDWLFEDDFSSGLGRWTRSEWRSAYSENANAVGWLQDWGPSGTLDNVEPPDNAQIFSGQLWIGAGSQNYGDTMLRADQPWEFPSQTGVIELDMWMPDANPLNGWPRLAVTLLPYSAPSYYTGNGKAATPRYGFDIQFNRQQAFVAGFFEPYPSVMVYDDYVETIYDGSGGSASIDVTPHTMTHVKIEFTATTIDIYADSVLWFSETWSLPAELVEGYVYIGEHNHASEKYTPFALYVYTVVDNIKFGYLASGGQPDPTPTKQAAPSLTTIAFEDGDIGFDGIDTGWHVPDTVTITGIPNPATIDTARLLFNLNMSAAEINPATTTMTYTLNGGTPHAHLVVQGDYVGIGDLSGATEWSLPISVGELTTGSNTVEIEVSTVGGNTPWFGNVGILYKLSDVLDATVTTPAPAIAVSVGRPPASVTSSATITSPPRGVSTAVANVPTVSSAATVTSPPRAISTAVANVPTVAVNAVITPGAASSASVALSPTVTAATVITAPVASASSTARTPTSVTAATVITPTRAIAAAVAPVPSVSTGLGVFPSAAVSGAVALAPVVTSSATITPSSAVAGSTANVPSVSTAAGANISSTSAVSTAVANAVTVSVGQTITPSSAVSTAVANVPVVSSGGGATITPPATSSAAVVPAGGIFAGSGAVITPTRATSAAVVNVPTVVGQQNVSIVSPPRGTSAAVANAPTSVTAGTGAAITPTSAVSVAGALVPASVTAVAHATITSPPRAIAIAVAQPPSSIGAGGNASVSPGSATSAAVALAPVVTTSGTIASPVAVAGSQARVPTVTATTQITAGAASSVSTARPPTTVVGGTGATITAVSANSLATAAVPISVSGTINHQGVATGTSTTVGTAAGAAQATTTYGTATGFSTTQGIVFGGVINSLFFVGDELIIEIRFGELLVQLTGE